MLHKTCVVVKQMQPNPIYSIPSHSGIRGKWKNQAASQTSLQHFINPLLRVHFVGLKSLQYAATQGN